MKEDAKIKMLDFFKKKGKSVSTDSRLPAGQRLTAGFPVLDLGFKPQMDMASWKLFIDGEVEHPQSFTLDQLKKLGDETFIADFHCVTSWSKYDVNWKGVALKRILAKVKPKKSWNHLIQYGLDNYTTNVPREDVERDDVFLVYELDGKPIPQEHGYVRLIIPHLYAWKTSKFLNRLEFSKEDKPGYWEVRGYHNRGNAFLEERYS
ncbi:MAG TPA: molybdopterin-dependent oxidoreductase [Acidobacteriota bacterium]|nr:molybdopterin-dependent oxidoreductase [Acidobacteriota bacterium]